MCLAQAGTVCSLSGFAPLHPYANPLLVSKVTKTVHKRASSLVRLNFVSSTRRATTPLIVTAVLNSTRAALTRATHSDRRPLDTVSLADFRTGGVPGSEKPTPASPKGDRRSVLSEKEIQDSDNCSCLHMGCPYYLIDKQLYSSTGSQGG